MSELTEAELIGRIQAALEKLSLAVDELPANDPRQHIHEWVVRIQQDMVSLANLILGDES